MKRNNFRKLTIDERVKTIKQIAKQFFIWDYQSQTILTTLNPVITIHADGIYFVSDCVELSEIYFCSLSYLYENEMLKDYESRSLQM
jgi:hypothetical protein